MYPLGNVSICYMSIRYIALLTRKGTTAFIPPTLKRREVSVFRLPFSAKIIAATVNQPIVGETLISTYKPTILIGGS
jgi:hypothetical protein